MTEYLINKFNIRIAVVKLIRIKEKIKDSITSYFGLPSHLYPFLNTIISPSERLTEKFRLV